MSELERIVEKLEDHSTRLNALEASTTMSSALRAQREAHMDARFDRIETGMSEIKGYLLRVVWVVMIAVLTGVLGFIINGGLTNVPGP